MKIGSSGVDRLGVAADHQAVADLRGPRCRPTCRRPRSGCPSPRARRGGGRRRGSWCCRRRRSCRPARGAPAARRSGASVASPAGTMIQTARGFVELGDELGDRERRASAPSPAISVGLLRRPVVDDDSWPSRMQPADHVAAHPAEPDEPDAHRGHASVAGVERPARRAPARGRPARRRGVARRGGPAAIGRSCASMAREVARGLGVDELAEGVRPARDRPVGRVVRRSAGGTSRSARRPCAAGRSSAGSAGRSRPSWRGRSGRAAAPGCGRAPRRASGVGAMNAWRQR